MIENTAARAIISGGVGLVVFWLLARLLLSAHLMLWYFEWAAFLVAVGVAVWAFIGLKKPSQRGSTNG